MKNMVLGISNHNYEEAVESFVKGYGIVLTEGRLGLRIRTQGPFYFNKRKGQLQRAGRGCTAWRRT